MDSSPGAGGPRWLLCVASMPADDPASRMRVLRTLESLGTTVLREGVYLLPETEANRRSLETLAEYDDDDAIFAALGADVLGSPWDKLVILAIVTSAVASTQTTIIPSSRTSFSMARQRALPRAFAAVHPRFHTPWFSTSVIAALAIVWYVPINLLSENFLFDTLSALSLMIAFYYALTGFACAIFYRRELTKSIKNLLFIGVGPVVGAVVLGFLFVKSAIDLSDAENSYSGQEVLGMGVPFVIGMGFLLLGFVLLVLWRLAGNERFFGRKAFEAVDPAIAAGDVAPATAGGEP